MPVLCFGLWEAGVDSPPQYSATLLSNAAFTYNLTTASAQFFLWGYTETRHFTNTSAVTGLPVPNNPYTYYSFTSCEAGCSYYGYPLVLDVGRGPNTTRASPRATTASSCTRPAARPWWPPALSV